VINLPPPKRKPIEKPPGFYDEGIAPTQKPPGLTAGEEEKAQETPEADDAIQADLAAPDQEAEEAAASAEADNAKDAPQPQELEEPEVPEQVASGDSAADAPDPDEDDPAPDQSRQCYNSMEVAAQVHQVQEWLTLGYRPNQIRAFCNEKWGIKTRAAESRMAMARRQIVLDVNVYDRKEAAAKMMQSLETVLEQAIQMRQGSNAIGAMRLQADLMQLLARQQ